MPVFGRLLDRLSSECVDIALALSYNNCALGAHATFWFRQGVPSPDCPPAYSCLAWHFLPCLALPDGLSPPPPQTHAGPLVNLVPPLCGGVPCAVRALCEKLAVLHHREFGKFRRLKGRH